MHNPDDHRYDDMLHTPRHVSTVHRPMTQADRAAQFSPFAALTGYDAAIAETARLTDTFAELSEDAKAVLNEKFLMLMENISAQPEITVTYFREDERKSGGAYQTVTDSLRKIDTYARVLQLCSGASIPMEMICDVQSEIFRSMDK